MSHLRNESGLNHADAIHRSLLSLFSFSFRSNFKLSTTWYKMPDVSSTIENAGESAEAPKSAAQLKKEAKRKEKLEKFKQKQEKIQAKTQNVEKAPVCLALFV